MRLMGMQLMRAAVRSILRTKLAMVYINTVICMNVWDNLQLGVCFTILMQDVEVKNPLW